MHTTIIRPVITEKSMKDTDKGKFAFLVRKSATKQEIKKAVEKLFGVTVIRVSTIVVKGKTQRVGPRRNEVVKEPMKKAVVAVQKGQKIDAFEIGA